MKANEETNERIEHYLAGALSEAERLAFEEQVKADSELAAALAMHQQAQHFLGDQKRMALRDLVHQVGEEYTAEQVPARNTFQVWRWAAAVVVLVGAALVYWVLGTGGNANSQELFAEYYQPYPAYHQQRDDFEEEHTTLDDAMERYANKDYEGAIVSLTSVLEEEDLPMVHFYLGICRLELEQLEAAEAEFIAVIDQQENFYASQAHWYLALTYLKLENQEAAKKTLQDLSKTGRRFFRGNAKELLQKISD